MIKIDKVSFTYGEDSKKALKNINLNIKKGEFIVLTGMSGSGKTSLSRIINGLIPNFYEGKFEGDIYLKDKNLKNMEMYEISKYVGSVFQNPKTQFFNVDTDSEIVFGLENRGYSSEKLGKCLSKVIEELNLECLSGKNIFKLSGGEKQKIAFASVYAMNPDIYVLDEPSSNLDIKSILELKKYLKKIKEQGKTIIISEHRLWYLMDLADEIIYLEDGEINFKLTPMELRNMSISKRNEMGLRSLELYSDNFKLSKKQLGKDKLKVQNLSIYYKKNAILENISFEARIGEIIAVVGDNGTGKTTLARTLCGLHNEAEGKIQWNNINMNKKERLKNSYIVMQDVNYQLFAESVEKECSFGILNTNSEIIESTINDLGLIEFRKRHPNTLSGGQKQRLAVAVAKISNKEILIFDEPTSGLDYSSMLKVSDIIKNLSKDRIIFIVTHDYEFINNSCSRILKFGQKKLLEDV